jgi:spore maturation protein B
MQMLSYLSNFILPLLVFYVIATACARKVNVYEQFLAGVREGLDIVVRLLPTLVALLVSVGVLRASGIFEVFYDGLQTLFQRAIQPDGSIVIGALKLPVAVLPVFFIRLFSSSAASGLLLDIFKEYGTDSLAGIMASITLSCTEAVLYCLSIYFAAVHITKVRWTLGGALLASLAGVVAAVVLANYWVAL